MSRSAVRIMRREGSHDPMRVQPRPPELRHAMCQRGCGSSLPPERQHGGVCKPCIDADMRRRGLDKLKPGDGWQPLDDKLAERMRASQARGAKSGGKATRAKTKSIGNAAEKRIWGNPTIGRKASA